MMCKCVGKRNRMADIPEMKRVGKVIVRWDAYHHYRDALGLLSLQVAAVLRALAAHLENAKPPAGEAGG